MGTVPTPLDWVANAGLSPTAAAFQAGVQVPLNFLLDPPGCQVRRTTAFAVPVSATPMPFDAEDSDNDTMHSTVSTTGRITCNTPGRFLFTGVVPFDAATSGQRDARYQKNTSTIVAGGRTLETTATATVLVLPSIEIALVAGDFVELYVASATAANSTAVNGLFPLFRARWVGP